MSGTSRRLRPVELDVLPRGEVAVALVPALGDHRQLAHLVRVQRAVGDRDAQHVGVQLQVEPVHQPQRLELVLGQGAVDPALHLAAELGDAGRGRRPRRSRCSGTSGLCLSFSSCRRGVSRAGRPACRGRSSRGRGCGTPRGNGPARGRRGRPWRRRDRRRRPRPRRACASSRRIWPCASSSISSASWMSRVQRSSSVSQTASPSSSALAVTTLGVNRRLMAAASSWADTEMPTSCPSNV